MLLEHALDVPRVSDRRGPFDTSFHITTDHDAAQSARFTVSAHATLPKLMPACL